MTELKLSKNTKSKCNSAIVISGAYRSGTTMIGQIIHSMKNVEYIFEPALFRSLFPLIEKMPAKQWQLLYETYLCNDFLYDALSGRRLNCNKKDYTLIYNTKSKKLVSQRYSKMWTKKELGGIARKSHVAYKLPSIVPFIPKLQNYYPKTRVIIIQRNPNDIFHSLKEKGWFIDEAMETADSIFPGFFPYHQYKNYTVPLFVKNKDIKLFAQLDELHRMAYYYIRMYENLRKIKNAIIIQYENFLKNPKEETFKLSKKLNLKYGEKTKDIISTIELRRKNRKENLLRLVNKEVRKKLEKL